MLDEIAVVVTWHERNGEVKAVVIRGAKYLFSEEEVTQFGV